MRFVAGKGAVAELLLAGAPWLSAIGKMLVGAPCQLRCCWQDAAGWGRYGGAVAGRGIAKKHFPSVNEIFYPFGCHQFTFFLNFAAVSALRL